MAASQFFKSSPFPDKLITNNLMQSLQYFAVVFSNFSFCENGTV